jgi:hypothetical protein
VLLVLAALAAGVSPLSAQIDACRAGRIAEIVIDNRSVVPDDQIAEGAIGWVSRLANRVHIRTRESFLRGELLFEEGDCYDPYRIADSERLLRRYNFIGNVEVFGVRLDDGSWRVRVETNDEWSTRIETTTEIDNGFRLRSAAISERNLLGMGMTIRGFLVQDDAERLLGATFLAPRLFGTRTNLGVNYGTTRVGIFRSLQVGYPFVGEVGRWGWQVGASEVEDYFQYSFGAPGERAFVLLPERDEQIGATVVRRFGTPGNLTIVGLDLTRQRLTFPNYPAGVEVVEGGRFDAGELAPGELASVIDPQTRPVAGTRLSLVFGQRSIDFVQRTGLDALRGVQDIQVGEDISLTLGRTIGGTGGDDVDDLFVRLRLYGATAPAPWVVVTDLSIQGRQLFFDPTADRSGWRDIFAEFDLLAYWQPPQWERHTFLARVAAAGGWSVDVPFQLTLGGREGVRGFDRADLPGGRRVVFTLEDRIYFGWPFPETFDLGATLFADVGRIWAGDVPFGEDTGWLGTVGAGLRFGFPSGSRGVVRFDVAQAIGPGAGGIGPILRFTAQDVIGLTGGLLDLQFQRSIRIGTGTDSFSPPR